MAGRKYSVTNMIDIAANIQRVRARIHAAESSSGREPGTVRLLAVSKGQPLAHLSAAAQAGVSAFGENYLQEALPKIAARPDLEWHFIGRIQSNKTRPIATHFAWVHGVDRLRIAERLSAQRAAPDPLNVCIEVNVDAQAAKGGVPIAELGRLARAVAALPHLRLRGLMALPVPADDRAVQRAAFAKLARLRVELNREGLSLDTLSIGTSAGLEAAVAEGATIVRVGTAIFGDRP